VSAQPVNDRALLLGVDGGGTTTVAWLTQVRAGEDDEILGRGGAGPGNARRPDALSNIEAAVTRAFADAASTPCTVDAACLALAGAGRDGDRKPVETWARRHGLARSLVVVTDVETLLALLPGCDGGVALVAGTGSIAAGRDAGGRWARAGGWGHLLGDEGSGHALALAGLRAALRAADGRGGQTVLLPELLGHLGVETPEHLVETPGVDDAAAIAALAPIVLQAAGAGDEVARCIVDEAAAALAAMVIAVHAQLELDGERVPLALGGGVLVGSALMRTLVLEQLERRGVRPEPVIVVQEPVRGAVEIARRVAMSE
jgi:N-acetylglucosamine kinase-like BadF-type ATPase